MNDHEIHHELDLPFYERLQGRIEELMVEVDEFAQQRGDASPTAQIAWLLNQARNRVEQAVLYGSEYEIVINDDPHLGGDAA